MSRAGPCRLQDNAREVGFDLDTEAKAMPQEEDEKKQDEEKENEEEQDLDRQQGDVDLSKGGMLDEKLWNGEDEDRKGASTDDKEDEKDGDEPEEKETGPQEDIEAHGAQGEGEADTTARDENDSSKKQPPLEDQKDDKADAKEAPEQD
eukprot:s348_g18.t1